MGVRHFKEPKEGHKPLVVLCEAAKFGDSATSRRGTLAITCKPCAKILHERDEAILAQKPKDVVFPEDEQANSVLYEKQQAILELREREAKVAAKRKRHLGLALVLSTQGEVQIAERVPEAGDKWLLWLDPRYPLTQWAAEALRERLCGTPRVVGKANLQPGREAFFFGGVPWHDGAGDQTKLREQFEEAWKRKLQELVADHWREGEWRPPGSGESKRQAHDADNGRFE